MGEPKTSDSFSTHLQSLHVSRNTLTTKNEPQVQGWWSPASQGTRRSPSYMSVAHHRGNHICLVKSNFLNTKSPLCPLVQKRNAFMKPFHCSKLTAAQVHLQQDVLADSEYTDQNPCQATLEAELCHHSHNCRVLYLRREVMFACCAARYR